MIKVVTIPTLLFICLSGCSYLDKPNPHYIKVVVFGPADSLTNYNKGVGLSMYSYMDLNTDSIIYRFVSNIEPKYQYTTYIGRIKDLNQNDSIIGAISALKHILNGVIKETVQPIPNSTYCGSEFYIEYRYGAKEKYVFYLESKLDKRLEKFNRYFYKLQSNHWISKVVNNNLINSDSIAIPALKRIGYYDSLAAPTTALVK